MSSELLISEVQKHPSLWNMSHPHYHNRLMNDRLWSSVAEAVNLSKDNVKTKWKNLRDTFNKEYKKIPKPRSGSSSEDAPIYTGKWSYLNSMMFIKDVVTPRDTDSNISESDVNNIDLNETAVEEGTETQVTDDLLSPSVLADISTLATSTPSTKKKQTEDRVCIAPDSVRPAKKIKTKEGAQLSDFEKELLKNEREKLALFKEPEDDDMHFLKSLLPYFKQMAPLQKLRVRSQIQDLLVNELSTWPTVTAGNSRSTTPSDSNQGYDEDYNACYNANTIQGSTFRNFPGHQH